MSVDCAYYSHGVRQAEQPPSLLDAASIPRRGGSYVWIELDEPGEELMGEIAGLFDLHELAVEDAACAHQRPKVEGYDGFHLIIYKTATYNSRLKQVEFGEVDIFVGVGYVIAVRHGAASDPIRTRLRVEKHPELLKVGPAAIVWGILDMVVDDYEPVVEALEGEIEDVERAIFAGREDLTERIYTLKTEINELYRALHPLLAPLEAMERGEFQTDPGLRRYFRDVADHVRRLQDEVIAQREQLAAVLEANLSLISLRQNEISAQQNQVVKQLTLVATVFLPLAFVTGFFGQNFGWMVHNINSLADFLIIGIGALLISAVALYAWFRQGGYVAAGRTTRT
ncbi:MAG TPA: magnesium and cobalt transport protein CorA [Thermoanaerobaculia bacterium]|nr:magnesium and cobalt transport protein CorA [Thermoanaerobaculia bacterium]